MPAIVLEQADTNDELSDKERAIFAAAFLFVPFACVLVSSGLYYFWKGSKPKRAKQINNLGFIIFGVQILIWFLVNMANK